jgi:hypothetical protein
MAHGLQANPADEQMEPRPAGNRTDLQMTKLTDEQNGHQNEQQDEQPAEQADKQTECQAD